MNNQRYAWALGLVATVASVGCSSEKAEETPSAEPTEEIPPEPAPETTSEANDAKGQLGGTEQSTGQTGRLLYKLAMPKNAKYAPYVNGVVKTKTMIDAVNLFNAVFTFPKDVNVTAKECGKVNAFYSASTHDVSLCYELMSEMHLAYSAKMAGKTDTEKMAITAKAFAFVVLHEAGHAFLGENNIGVLGGEEDVVDDMSGILFVANKQPEYPLHGTKSLVALSGASKIYSDEHSFAPQRYFNMLCLIYGSDPKKYAGVVGPEAEFKLPEARAVRCPGEWKDKKQALAMLVGPYLRK